MTETPPVPPKRAALLAAAERNLAEHACRLHRHLPGASVTETPRPCPADLRGRACGVWCVLSACARISLVLDV
ncbi:hypothetical protein ACFWMQ_27605, partial [Streptomyces sp. NPDC058372]